MIKSLPAGAVGDFPFVAIDTETTGLRVTDRPVEIAGVRLEDGVVVDSFQTLVQPGCPVPKEAYEIHGIDDAALVDAPPLEEALAQLTAFGQGAVWLAHNSGYDAGILATAYHRAAMAAPDEPMLDTCRLARSCLPGHGTYRLEHLGKALGLGDSGYHRALADAQVAAGVFVECVKRMGRATPLKEVARRAGGWLTVAGIVDAFTHIPPGFEDLADAVHSGRKVELLYDSGGKGRPTTLRVAPKVIYRGGDRAYMEAFCFDGRYLKSYRLDRVRSYRVL